MGGTSDFNVPMEGSEQMQEALQTQHVPSLLIAWEKEAKTQAH